LRLGSFPCGGGPCPPFAFDEVEIAQVSEYTEPLPQDEHRVEAAGDGGNRKPG